MNLIKTIIFFSFVTTFLCALTPEDEKAIHTIINDYTDAWNNREGKGFADGFADDADFVNIFAMVFSGREEIELRHQQILQSFLKNSSLHIQGIKLREVQPGVVSAIVDWKLNGFRMPRTDITLPGEMRSGVFLHIFIQKGNNWQIIATQNTLKPI